MLQVLGAMREFAKLHERTFAYLWTITLIYLLLSEYMALTLGG